jgi:hypothetical protein
MGHDLAEELVCEDDDVLESFGKHLIIRTAVVPDSRFPKETESRALDDFGVRRQRVRAKKDRGAENAFERGDQSTIFFPAFAHAEGVQHVGRALESDGLALLLNRKRRQEDRHNAVLTEGDAIIGMAGDLKNEFTVSPLIQELALWE